MKCKSVFISIMLLIITSLLFAKDENKAPFASLDIYEFKNVLEEGKIVSAKKGQWRSIEGLYISENGDTCKYKVDYFDGLSPFLKDALEKANVKLGHKLIDPEESNCYHPWEDPTFLFFSLLTLSILVLLILNLVWAVKILNKLKKD